VAGPLRGRCRSAEIEHPAIVAFSSSGCRSPRPFRRLKLEVVMQEKGSCFQIRDRYCTSIAQSERAISLAGNRPFYPIF
jgi:hypothetical protein